MSYLDPPNDLPPPPAYSDEDFERKTSLALELSLTTLAQPHDSHHNTYEGAAQALAASKHYVRGGSSQFHPVSPLKINKKAEPNTPSKPPPGWFNQTVVSGPPDSVGGAVSYSTHHLRADVDDRPTQPPPSFTSRGPSLDGPPYERIISSPWIGSQSNTPSPFVPPTWQAQPSRGDVHCRKPRHSLPQVPRTQHQTTALRPISQYPSDRSMPTPISTFDPSLAYHQHSNLGLPQRSARDYEARNDIHIHNVTALYNAAVVNHLKSPPTKAPRDRVVQQARDDSVSHLSPVRGQDFVTGRQMQGMTPTQNPVPSHFSQYTPYHPTTVSPGRNGERQTTSYYYYGDG
ncbi:hypothetical protein AX15_007676 [Amanita polypyramis BW_CC]|nr:hypothetical protein AX15_007676 [Amanita polypyramis BW_CC]